MYDNEKGDCTYLETINIYINLDKKFNFSAYAILMVLKKLK